MIDLLQLSSILLLIAPGLLVFSALGLHSRFSRPASVKLLFLLYGVPIAVTLAICLIWRIPATRVVIELRGIAFRSIGSEPLRKRIAEKTPGGGALSIGDGASRRSGTLMQFGTFVFHSGSGNAKGTLSITLPPPQSRAGLISDDGHGLLGAEELLDGDRICLQTSCWTFEDDDHSFANGNTIVRLPRREARIPLVDWTFPLPWAAPARAGSRTYALEALFSGGSRATPLRSFVCYSNPGSRLRLVTLDEGVALMRDGRRVSTPTTFDLDADAHLSFYSPPRHTAAFESPGIVERRSMRVHTGSQSFALELDTPETRSISVPELNALELRAQGTSQKTKSVGLAMGNAQMTDRSLYFSGISEAVALQANSLLELSRRFPRDFESSYGIVSPRGPTKGALGDVAWIGATDLAAFRLHVLRPPFVLLLAGLILQVLKIISASKARLTNQQALFAGALECLVAVRLLVGYRVWFMPPHQIEAAELAIVSWMALPWMYLVTTVVPALPPPSRDGQRFKRLLTQPWLPAMAGLLFSAVFCAQVVEGPRKLVWIACHAGAAFLALLRNVQVRKWMVAHASRLAAKAKRASRTATTTLPAVRVRDQIASNRAPLRLVLGLAAAVLIWFLLRAAVEPLTLALLLAAAFAAGWFRVRIGQSLRPLLDPELTPFLLWALAFCSVRVFLLLFGWKESLPMGGARVSLSAIYVPAAAILQGAFFWTVHRRVQRAGRLAAPDLVISAAILIFVWAIPAGITSDIGLALLNIPVFAILLLDAVRASAKRERYARSSWRVTAIPWALTAGVVVFLAIAPLWRLVIPLMGNEEAMLDRASDSNFVRFIHFAEPERLRELATKRGESLAVTSAILQRYIDSGWTGYGYGHSDISPHLGATALRDFAPAVFIAGEWGLAGTLSMLLLYASFFLIGHAGAPWHASLPNGRPESKSRSIASAVAFTAAASITVASIYMILANHELLLLTGKNAYLLGLDSAGDVLETMALVLVIAMGCSGPTETTDESRSLARQWWTS